MKATVNVWACVTGNGRLLCVCKNMTCQFLDEPFNAWLSFPLIFLLGVDVYIYIYIWDIKERERERP